MKKSIATFALALLLAGCASSGGDAIAVSDQQLQSFKKGVTTEQQIEAALGAPKASGLTDDGNKVVMYAVTRSDDPNQRQIVDLVTLIAAASHSGGKITKTDVSFVFDKTGVLMGYSVVTLP